MKTHPGILCIPAPGRRALAAILERSTRGWRRVPLLAAIVVVGGSTFASERWETLQAINWVENPHNSPKAGPAGELGPYQFRPSTWFMHTTKPFALAVERQYADEVAVKHYEWIKRGLTRNGIAATPYNIALAWNAGLDRVINDQAPAASCQYADRVNNLVEDLKGRRLASTQ